ncbi:MAG: redoxin domain-containing protein [Pirellulales bacterium]|nr:redoxin domain-containing protein [Pirellulales bacterium]
MAWRPFVPVLVVAAALDAWCGFDAGVARADDAGASPVGRSVPDFSLADTAGTVRTLAQLADRPAVVVAFLGVECPLVGLYIPRLNELAAEYADRGVAFLAINSNQQDSLAEISHLAQVTKLAFPLLKDPGNVVADAFGAERTPEVFLLDAQHKVRYRGRIDDQFGVGYQRAAPTRRDLAVALDAVLQQRAVEIAETVAPGCRIGRLLAPDPTAGITWAGQIAAIFQRRCQNCHRPGQIGPFSLQDYGEVVGWAGMIGEVVEAGRMPPWHAEAPWGTFENEGRLLPEEREAILAWVAAGAPSGDLARVPPPPNFSTGWLLPRYPDLILPMSDRAYDVAPAGVIEYQYFVVDPKFTHDVWIDAAEARPGNRAVVHHVNIFVAPPEVDAARLTRDELAELWALQNHMLCGYVPGMRPTTFPAGLAKPIPAGSRIVFQMHYTPTGAPQQDLSSLGLIFAPPGARRTEVTTVPAVNNWFEIPPGDPAYRADVSIRVKSPALLLAMLPHMHLRGKSFRYTAEYPDGHREVLLDVPRYDFLWQNRYILAEPKRLPAGTRIHCEAGFDNSAENPANPDPTATVRWGEQSWEEMLIGYFDVAPLDDPRAAPAGTDRRYAYSAAVGVLAIAASAWWLSRRPRGTAPSPAGESAWAASSVPAGL